MRRDNIFRSVYSGRLGLTHLFLSQFAWSIFLIREQEHLFVGTIIQRKLANLFPECNFTGDANVTLIYFDHLKQVF